MGRPNNKKKGKGRAGGGARAAASSGGGAKLGADPNYYKKPAQFRPAPDMSVLRAPHKLRETLFAVDPADRSATARRIAEAYEIVDGLEARLDGLPGADSGPTLPIADLVSSPEHMQNVISLCRGMSISDFRVPAFGRVFRRFALPSCWMHITKLHTPAGSTDEPQLMNIGAREMVVLLSAAVALQLLGRMRFASSVVHELRIHAESGCVDWGELEGIAGDISPPMTEVEVRFFLAQLGVKCTRKLYREGEDSETSAVLGKVSKKGLLGSIEVFAKDLVRFRPDCAQGYYILAWIETQKPRIVKGSDPLAAAADCLHLLRKSYEAADAEDDAFLKAEARIDAAYCLVHGAGGIVGLAGTGNVVERDMRSKAAKVIAKETGTILSFENFVVRASTAKEQARIAENERRRLAASIPETRLDPGETILIAHWEVRRLWNEAMVAYDDVCRWGWSHVVYGESTGWDAVTNVLKQAKKIPYNKYMPGPAEPGFEAIRDKGQGHFNCGWCGKYGGRELHQCGRCKKAYYCGKVCATKDWKQGGHKERCQKA